ncbi:outer membrane beta-barrel protein [Massilia sp. TSP1-1-2]|uniref:outer membrane beta-barrel protein n=1 Tax=Massilia sp. TSP1-1-2 TaxID=2804649 RepID=UPI003CEBA4FC
MFKKIVIASALALMASASFAQTAPSVYAGGQINSTKVDGYDRETGAGLFLGYQFNETYGLEVGYARLADFDAAPGVNVKLNQMSLSGIATLPLSNGFNVFGRLGYNRIDAKASGSSRSATEDTSGALYGIGLGYNFSPTIAGRVEFQKASSDSTSAVAAIVFKF